MSSTMVTSERTAAAAVPLPGELDTAERLAVVAADASAHAAAQGFVYAAWLTHAATMVPHRSPLSAADVFGLVVDAVMASTDHPRPVATRVARPAHDTLTELVRERAPWLAKHENPVGEYVPYLTRSALVGLLLSAGMRATWRVGGAR
jgi:hypothetical protein